ncbi:5136_t:CDS:2 [Paraglomus occultum]|uniref:5136_t:CDS:1 n=1 Tax=Paraglomus occultum TaxID=144539 RepID=A0A9N9B967_9GLOM|nr:5136_t:CDS:2 [Paraglomus occultum]
MDEVASSKFGTKLSRPVLTKYMELLPKQDEEKAMALSLSLAVGVAQHVLTKYMEPSPGTQMKETLAGLFPRRKQYANGGRPDSLNYRSAR